jgi:lipoyl(octanoyl) transferase
MQKQLVEFLDLGIMDYKSAWDYQEKLLQENVEIKSAVRRQEAHVQANSSNLTTPNFQLTTQSHELQTKNYLLFVEHPPVYTLGKSGNVNNVLINDAQRTEKGIEFFNTNRGGDITFHGPQQIVGYPIFDLEKFYTDIGRYLRELEEVIILTLANFEIIAGRSTGETGVWIDANIKGKERKICAMGVRCSRWITMHGFALNVNTDLSYFNYIIPCGIVNKKVTSMKKELNQYVNLEDVKQKLRKNFEKIFDVVIENKSN